MQLIDQSKKTLGRLRFSVATGRDIMGLHHCVFVAPSPFRFAWAVLLNFGCRALHLAAFILSIQAITLAFQFASSDGDKFRAKSVVDWLHIPLEYLPIVVPVFVALVFGAPALLKKLEMRQLDHIVHEIHDRLGKSDLVLRTDIFMALRIPAYLVYAAKFCSGLMFILIALCVVAIFRIDLFFLILLIAFVLAVAVTLSSLRQINAIKALSPMRAAYTLEAREHHRDATGARSLATVDEVPLLPGDSRDLLFKQATQNWIRFNRSTFNQGIFSGIGIGAIVWFVFGLEDIDESQLLLLIYLVIAIRYAINTARETGSMMTRLLEVRTELTDYKIVADLCRGGTAASSPDPVKQD